MDEPEDMMDEDEPEESSGAAEQLHDFLADACRLLAAVPPLALTLVVSDLTLTLRVAGLAGLVVAFFIPAALQWALVRASSAFLLGAEQIGAYYAVGRFPETPLPIPSTARSSALTGLRRWSASPRAIEKVAKPSR